MLHPHIHFLIGLISCLLNDFGVYFRREDVEEGDDTGSLVELVLLTVTTLGNDVVVVDATHVALQHCPKDIPVLHQQEVS